MTKKWLVTLNQIIVALSILCLLAAAILTFLRPKEIEVINQITVKSTLPKGSFQQPKQAYEAIGEPFLGLKYSKASIQLPDLRKALTFYGINGRPDAELSKPLLHFAFNGNKSLSSVSSGEKLFLRYDKSLNPPQYVFSPKNEETHLWIEAEQVKNEALVKVRLRTEEGEEIQEPSLYAQFSLHPKELGKSSGTASMGEIGKWRIDGSLLARQKARWYGCDRFLEKHGGEEFQFHVGKQRIDFAHEEDAPYSVFVAQGDCLIWNNDRWQVVSPGKDSLGHPLLVIKKIDDRLMNCELWDVDGKGKIALNLLKSNEPNTTENVENTFRFVGARTRSQFVFEIDEERMLLRPQDWLVMTEEGWKKLSTPEEIDSYVDRKIQGPLFIFDGIARKDERQVLVGTMFNTSRTDMQTIELPIMQAYPSGSSIERSNDDEESNTVENPVAHFKTSNTHTNN